MLAIFLFLPISVAAEFAEDLKNVTDHFECDPQCIFNHSEVTSATIEFFPKCQRVCGILIMNENLDLNESKLKEAFRSVSFLSGGIRIENTQLRNLNFFNVNKGQFSVFCELYGFVIKNNKNLRNINAILRFYLYGDNNNNECDFRVENSANLDTEILYDRSKMKVCRQDEIVTLNSMEYKTCANMFGGLRLNGIQDDRELYSIRSLRQLFGPLIVENTSLKDLTILSSLKWLQADVLKKDEPAFINIRNNLEMRTLGTYDLLKFRGNRIVNFENLHPEFCLTYEEMRRFLKYGTFFINLHVAGYCQEEQLLLIDRKYCNSSSLEELPSDCIYLFRDLIIESGQEHYVSKLKKLAYLFGKLIVNNTKLEDFSFLSNLQHIAALDEYPPIQIIGNLKLKSAKLLKLKSLITKGPQYVLLENNHPELSENYMDLFSQNFQSWINYTSEYIVPLRAATGCCSTESGPDETGASGVGKIGLWAAAIFWLFAGIMIKDFGHL